MKRTLADSLGILLLKQGYTVKQLSSSGFDLVARKDEGILLIKVLEDANSITEEYAVAMAKVSNYIKAAPLIIAKKAGDFLEDGVVYTRFGISTLNYNTLLNTLENDFPFIFSSKAGLTAALIGEKLKKKRENAGISLGDVSRKLKVSRRMIQKYESGDSAVSVAKAYCLYKLFGSGIFKKISLFHRNENLSDSKKSEFAQKYYSLGFEADDISSVPFDIIAKKGNDVVLTEIGEKTSPHLLPLQKLIEANTLVIFKREKPEKIPALTRKEFMNLNSAEELIKLLKDFE